MQLLEDIRQHFIICLTVSERSLDARLNVGDGRSEFNCGDLCQKKVRGTVCDGKCELPTDASSRCPTRGSLSRDDAAFGTTCDAAERRTPEIDVGSTSIGSSFLSSTGSGDWGITLSSSISSVNDGAGSRSVTGAKFVVITWTLLVDGFLCHLPSSGSVCEGTGLLAFFFDFDALVLGLWATSPSTSCGSAAPSLPLGCFLSLGFDCFGAFLIVS